MLVSPSLPKRTKANSFLLPCQATSGNCRMEGSEFAGVLSLRAIENNLAPQLGGPKFMDLHFFRVPFV